MINLAARLTGVNYHSSYRIARIIAAHHTEIISNDSQITNGLDIGNWGEPTLASRPLKIGVIDHAQKITTKIG